MIMKTMVKDKWLGSKLKLSWEFDNLLVEGVTRMKTEQSWQAIQHSTCWCLSTLSFIREVDCCNFGYLQATLTNLKESKTFFSFFKGFKMHSRARFSNFSSYMCIPKRLDLQLKFLGMKGGAYPLSPWLQAWLSVLKHLNHLNHMH